MPIDREQIGKLLRETYARVLEEMIPERIVRELRNLGKRP